MFSNFNPDNFTDYLPNDLFHHPDKGCELETIENFICLKSVVDGHEIHDETHSFHQQCLTHNRLCSKTGWELHHYQNREENSFYKGSCKCGRTFYSLNKDKITCCRCQQAIDKEKRIAYRLANKIPLDKRKKQIV